MWMAREYMKNLVIELAKNGNVSVDAERVSEVVAMAQSVGIIACGGALIKREDGGFNKVLYTEQPEPAWVSLVEELMCNKWVEVAPEDVEEFVGVCRALCIVACGGAIVARGGVMLQGFYIE